MEEVQKRGFTGVWMPKEVLDSKEMSFFQKVLYCDIASFEDCFMSNARLAERYNVSERTITSNITALIEAGFIIQTAFDGRSRHLAARHVATMKDVKLLGRVEESFYADPKQSSRKENSIDNKETLAETKVSEENFQEVDDILVEVDEEYAPSSSLRKRKGPAPSEPLMEWAARKTGRKFALPVKQRTAILALKRAGYDEEDIKAFWLDLEVDPYWSSKGIDFTIILSQIDKMSNRVDLKQLKKQFDARVKEWNRMAASGSSREEIKEYVDKYVRPLRDKYGFR